jgi:leucine dehydrogenase
MAAVAIENLREPPGFDELLREWDGEQADIRYDAESGAWMFVCLHSTRLGPAAGGTRMRVYPSPAEGLADAMRLSEAMTRKLAVAGLPFGGGKAVLAVPEIPHGEDRRRLFLRYAELVESLGGRFWTGPDMNTNECDMNLLPYALIRSEDRGGAGSSAPATAVGVLHGIRASVRHVFGSNRLDGLVVLVQGVGGVGGHLAGLLVEAGARVIVSDVDAKRVHELTSRLPVRAVVPERALRSDCDVFAPCAIGGILNEGSIPRLRCRVVAGAANNQLATALDGELLREAGILYAPDYVINAGGALHGIGLAALGWTRDELDRQLARIGETLAAIYRAADEDGFSTSEAADRLAAARLAERAARELPERDPGPQPRHRPEQRHAEER